MTAYLLPIEVDPRPCELCGLTIDQHIMVDDGEGPEFYCSDDGDDFVRSLVRQWELDDPRDRWKHTGEPAPKPSPLQAKAARPYSTARATIDAFFYVVGLGDIDYLTGWLARHPMDALTLHKLWEGKDARS
jgi:hypothetical protein